MDIIPPVVTADDLEGAIRAAADNEDARWYLMKKADSLHRLDALPTEWGEPIIAANREFSKETRDKYADEGIALSDGSFPIPDKDALRRAISSYGRANESDRAKVRRHIKKRAKALDATDMIPDEWKSMTSSAADGDDIQRERLLLERETLAGV